MIDQVRTCYPAQIISFDAEKQTATVKLSMERIFSDLQAFYKTDSRQVIEDVPVYFTEAGEYCITVDVKEGDDCLVWFAYRGYDHWLYDGKQEAGLDEQGFPYHYMERVNDISDAFVTTGFRPIPHAIPNFQKNALEIRNKSRGQRVTLFESGNINIHNPSSDVVVDCTNFIVNASSSVKLQTPSVTTTGTVHGDKTAEFVGNVTSPNFVLSVSKAAKDLVDLIKRYTGHTHNYTDDGSQKVTQAQNDA